MVLHRPVELANIFGKFDGSGVSGSTGRGRSQALESKVRFSFCRRTHYAPQVLRVCANCVIEDRRKNGGKTYWRRAHQLPLAASTMWLLITSRRRACGMMPLWVSLGF